MKNFYHQLKTAIFIFCSLCCLVAAAQPGNGSIKGTVLTSDGKPAAYVTVKIKEAHKQTATTEKGTYAFKNLPVGNYTIVLSHVGHSQQQQQVTVNAGQVAELNFTLAQSATELSEININSGKTINTTPTALGKADISPMDLPQSSGVVTNKVIEDQQINRLGDAVRNVSGVTLTQTRGGVGETFTARGYSIGIGGGSGSIFKDGVLTNTAGFPEASTLESIEVLKGSSALLYGNVSGGVIINMVTKKPKFENGGEVSMRYGSYNMYKPAVDVYGPISKNLAFRVVSTYENDGSYRDNVKTERFYVNPSLLYKAGEKTTIILSGDYLKSNLTPDWGVGSLNLGQAINSTVPRSQFINTSWAYSHMDQYSGTLTVNHQLADAWRLNFITSSQGTKIDSYGSGLPNNVAANGDWNRGLARANTTENNYTAQLNLNGTFKTGGITHQLLVGTDFAKVTNLTNTYTIQGLSTINGAANVYDVINIIDLNKYTARTDMPNTTDTALTKAPSYRFGYYIQDLISLTDKFKILAGLRYSVQKTVATYVTSYARAVDYRGSAANKVDGAFSPKIALIYEPVATTSIYAGYTNNFVINTGTNVATGQAMTPSVVDQYEAGIKNKFFDDKLSANISVYKIINQNLAVQSPYTTVDGPIENTNTALKKFSGQTTSNGVEIDISGNISKNLYFITGYAYNHAFFSNTTGLKGSNLEGEPIVINPSNTANGSIFYKFSGGQLKGFKLGASAFYTGFRYAGYNNTVGQTQKYNRLLPVGGFATLDLSAGYTYKKLSLLASVTNVTNTMNYLIHDNYSVTPIPPTQFLTTLAYKF
ncbi:iron complex outermembrane receptor protein [Mucilaginibacter gracilis]|uniref:Iron complex outermembrane receptor protein n=1 Tax=Mucilaginibacter gracilis TaxID=423350 RepID=A0A495IWW3_9SPHI|nr:TonB-dependent receptor [Mucilaginibacter gracilis]RKR81226.1 iron complex outermembrane receptor protein [Mucilaginibacter gracilis]